MLVAMFLCIFVCIYTVNSLTPCPIPTNQNTTKKSGLQKNLIFASIGVFPLIKVSPINTHMHHLLLGRGGVSFGVSSFFVYVAMGAAQQRSNAFFSSTNREVFSLGSVPKTRATGRSFS
jgi:hypothetical protein